MIISNQEHLDQISSRLDLFTHRKYSYYRHIGIWITYWLIFIISYESPNAVEPYATYFKIGISFTLFIQAYLNMYWLVPVYLFRKKFVIYLTVLLVMLISFSLIIGLAGFLMRELELKYAPKQLFDPKPTMYFAFALVFVAASSAIKFFQRWIEDTREITELTQVNIRSELEQLKNQVNPHFLFNMLNNANVLIGKDPHKASQVLMSLSDLLRYQLYDSARPEVLLTSDINFLNDCLNLEMIRRDHFDFIISKEGNLSGIQIPPFLFITFVENAIKHSQDADKPSYVQVYFDTTDGWINFKCVNSKPINLISNNNAGGLGLVNVRRRLELIFGAHHKLKISETKDIYTVKLAIKL
ncbi:histidine kinase [Pedobacter aquatilis]|uniref:sensor histidine kinase n=1 Tax=Pedobacter aquatilis TaxID=351343 RepID=UPI0025B43304|nr:histidine kinase [Pedobacter aquatilis]MDN3587589.1 histidine kinase [Pedobacter aquatilis]